MTFFTACYANVRLHSEQNFAVSELCPTKSAMSSPTNFNSMWNASKHKKVAVFRQPLILEWIRMKV